MKRLEDPSLHEIRETLEPARVAVQEASHALRSYLAKLEADPQRLEEIETRLAALGKLKRKYGGTIDEILRFSKRSGARSRRSKTRASAWSSFAKPVTRWPPSTKLAAKLTKLPPRCRERTEPPRGEGTRFARHGAHCLSDRSCGTAQWSETGADKVLFLVSPNRGEEPRPLEKIASGGEISRIALALKTCLVSKSQRPAAHARFRRSGYRYRRQRGGRSRAEAEADLQRPIRCSA